VLEGALILIAGIAAGWVLRSLPPRREDPEPVEAVCGCAHHYSFHDPETGMCHGTASQATHFDSYGIERRWKQIPCTCRKYAGPEPLSTYLPIEIATEAGE